MLEEMIVSQRARIIERTRSMVASRRVPRASEFEIEHGVPIFLDQLVARLHDVTGGTIDIAATASRHGAELWQAGVLICQVVHGYGDVCQAITSIALEDGASFSTEEFRTLNLCLDIAIAEAVGEFSRRSEARISNYGVEQLGFLAHELRNLLGTATLAFDALRSGNVGAAGSTGGVLGKSLDNMTVLVARSLAEVRLAAEAPHLDRVLVTGVLEEVSIAATMQAKTRGVKLAIEPCTSDEMVQADSQIMSSILINLVQNACKFTPPGGQVTLRARVYDTRIAIDVEDQCGGLPAGTAEELFRPFAQRSENRTGVGLGLAICKRGADAIAGKIAVRDMPGVGCVFTLDLPRAAS